MICFPLDNTQYEAKDMGAYLATRTRGVFSADDNLKVSPGQSGLSVTVSPGLVWHKWSQFWGVAAVQEKAITLTLDAADGALNRIDAIVSRLNKTNNRAEIVVKKGSISSAPSVAAPVRNESADEVYLATVLVEAGAVSIRAAAITDQRLNEEYCGLMRDGVTAIPTAMLQQQVQELIGELRREIAGVQQGSEVMLKTVYGGSAPGVVAQADKAREAANAETARSANVAQDSELLATHPPAWYAPPGMIAPYAGKTAPAGWLLCDGREVLRASYPALFAAIGTTFGAGDGKASFHLPDLRGRVVAGASTSNALATKAGADSKAIEKKHLPVGGVAITFASDKDNAVERNVYATPTWSKKYTINSNGIETGDGTNTPLDVRQSTLYLGYIIKA